MSLEEHTAEAALGFGWEGAGGRVREQVRRSGLLRCSVLAPLAEVYGVDWNLNEKHLAGVPSRA